jgi:hypothetical protein
MNTFNNVRNVFFNFTLSSWDDLWTDDEDWEERQREEEEQRVRIRRER